MTKRHEDLMILSPEKRLAYFRHYYTLALARENASNPWVIKKLPEIVDRAVSDTLEKNIPSGEAFKKTKKFFGIKTNKELFVFLGITA